MPKSSKSSRSPVPKVILREPGVCRGKDFCGANWFWAWSERM